MIQSHFWRATLMFLSSAVVFACQKNESAQETLSPYYQTVSTPRQPEENRFTRTVITEHLNEPMELVVADDGRVFFVDRNGALRRYDPQTDEVKQINTLPVITEGGNGLLGITLDPDFATNQYVYLFYTPQAEPLHQSVSRFTLGPDSLDYASEKVILEIPVEMESSAHTGGSLQFDAQGHLWISVGDNTTPFASDGFAPIDEREGRLEYDAQRSSGNTHDLRGKILRITPQADGSYTIPEGNLFPTDGSQGSPEIYVMGCRNPYRMSVDTVSGYVYWGEIGPDSGVDGKQGPRGYDEINQAKEPGFYGWPYFVGDSKPYLEYDFATQQVGDTFDVARPVNHSPNNTGSEILPPARKAMIWYPYNESEEFPIVGTGGRSAMAGPVYHFDPDLESDVKFPAYLDGALFIFDWMRDWVMTVFLDEQGNLQRIERFMEHTQIDRPIDMQFGPEGALYMLEYGENYGKNNPDASLVKITFNPFNRPPVAVASVQDTLGAAPLQVKLSGSRSFDYDSDDQITYSWTISDQDFEEEGPEASYTFNQPGTYEAVLTVTDQVGQKGNTKVRIRVGNTLPEVAIETTKNRTFYWDQETLDYQVMVRDPEDEVVDTARLDVIFSYLPQGKDIPGMLVGHQQTSVTAGKNRGKELLEQSDCKACHMLDQRTVGPSFKEIALRYEQSRPVSELAKKIIEGGGGVWGEHAMSAHPQLEEEEAAEMVNYILTLSEEEQRMTNLPQQGSIDLKHHMGKREPGTYLLTASYTDKGGEVIGPLTNNTLLALRAPRVQVEEADSLFEATIFSTEMGGVLGQVNHGSYFVLRQIDLKNIQKLTYRLSSKDKAGAIEVHLDAPDGKVVSQATYKATGDWEKMKEITATVEPTEGMHDLYFVFVKPDEPNDNLLGLDWVEFHQGTTQTASATSMR